MTANKDEKLIDQANNAMYWMEANFAIDCLIILVSYLFIIKLNNFWNAMYFEQVQQIKNSETLFSQEE
jgi:hypothetical protein